MIRIPHPDAVAGAAGNAAADNGRYKQRLKVAMLEEVWQAV